MISSHGNKNLAATTGMCLTTAALLLGDMAAEKRSKIKLYEKKYAKALSALEINNQKLMVEENLPLKISPLEISEK